mmetsp:Transcript_26622/g.66903  ORF Transcript_26622/g.66903 Transcript_26622/m.66903 type:complete len:460 (+) Transcript_26622:511-1890(+)
MSCDGHQMATVGHHIGEHAQMTVVHVATVEGDHGAQFAQQRVAHRLDAEHLDDLDDLVGRGAASVHLRSTHHRQQVHTLRVQHPLLQLLVVVLLEAAVLTQRDLGLFTQEHLADVRNTTKRQLVQQVLLEGTHQLIRVVLLHGLQILHGLFVVPDADAQHQRHGVVIGKDTVQTLLGELGDAAMDVPHAQILVGHHARIQLDAQQPRTQRRDVHRLIGHVKVGLHELTIFLHHRVQRIGIVPNLGLGGDASQSGELDVTLHLLGVHQITTILLSQEHRQTGSFGLFGNVDQLFQTRNTKSYILCTHTSIMKSVQGHLGGRFTNTLSSQSTDHLSRINNGLLETHLDLTDQPLERLAVETILVDDTFTADLAPQKHVEQLGGSILCLLSEWTGARNDSQSLSQMLQTIHDRERMQVGVLPRIQVEDLLCVPHQPIQIDRKRPASITARCQVGTQDPSVLQ